MNLHTCVAPSGKFIYGIHKPSFRVENLREKDYIASLGSLPDGQPVENNENFPADTVEEPQADWIFEIPNAFPFRGSTFILKSRADSAAANPAAIMLPKRTSVSLSSIIKQWCRNYNIEIQNISDIMTTLPKPLLLALAATSTDPQDLILLAGFSADFIYDPSGDRPIGIVYKKGEQGQPTPSIKHKTLFHTLANNIFLPDDYKDVMVLKPGAQGGSEIVGEWQNEDSGSHVFEYFRRNSYIPWGHYAANMANDAVRYQIDDLTMEDVTAMRHLYYQRSYVRLADELGIGMTGRRKMYTPSELDELRNRINEALFSAKTKSTLQFNSTLWGWNFGFDFSPSRFRLHASHQQIHQQYGLIPATVSTGSDNVRGKETAAEFPAFSCGDLISTFIKEYLQQTGKHFFETYIKAIRSNHRMDRKQKEKSSLVVYADENVMVFIPKAQTSQWEIQLMALKPIGNILEADTSTRQSLDRAMLVTIKILAALGASLVTTIEYSKRFDNTDTDQRLIYAFLPRLPQSPGAYTEAQLRWIINHYPEDFAAACRSRLPEALNSAEI
jgi:hypothetical protein